MASKKNAQDGANKNLRKVKKLKKDISEQEELMKELYEKERGLHDHLVRQ